MISSTIGAGQFIGLIGDELRVTAEIIQSGCELLKMRRLIRIAHRIGKIEQAKRALEVILDFVSG